jgi:hypothetical protein
MSDLLRMDYINSLPQPFIATMLGGSRWPVYDIDVEKGLMRLDVMGKLDITHIVEVAKFTDADGVEHTPDSFYNEDEATAVGEGAGL